MASNSTRRTTPVQPAAPQCLHPACHAHNAHPGSRPQTIIPPQPTTPPARPRQFKITKNWIIGFLIIIVIGLAGTINDRDQQIAGLKVKVGSTKIATPSEKLDYATRICKITHSQATYAQCVINIVGH